MSFGTYLRCWIQAQGLVGCQEDQIQGVDPDPPETPGSYQPYQVHQLDLAFLRPPGHLVLEFKIAFGKYHPELTKILKGFFGTCCIYLIVKVKLLFTIASFFSNVAFLVNFQTNSVKRDGESLFPSPFHHTRNFIHNICYIVLYNHTNTKITVTYRIHKIFILNFYHTRHYKTYI